MNRSSLGTRMVLSSLVVASGAGLLFGLIAWNLVSSQVYYQASQEGGAALRNPGKPTQRLHLLIPFTKPISILMFTEGQA